MNNQKTNFVFNNNIDYDKNSNSKMIIDGNKFIRQNSKINNHRKNNLIIQPIGIISTNKHYNW